MAPVMTYYASHAWEKINLFSGGSNVQIMGCRSYAEFAIRPNMAASPNVVMDFLLTLSNMVRPRADAV